jgi:hypothetical protein
MPDCKSADSTLAQRERESILLAKISLPANKLHFLLKIEQIEAGLDGRWRLS